MIGSYYNSSIGRDQYDIVKKIKGNSNDQTGSDADVCTAIAYASGDLVTFEIKNSALSFSECQEEIDNGDPFVAKLASSNISHVIVVSGYQTGSINYLYVIVPDPDVDEQYFSYTALINGTTGTLGTRKYSITMLRK